MSPIPLLTSAYLAPVHYYTKLISAPFVVEERSDHYVKQTFRNRCVIATADGTQSLTIPVQGCKELGGDHKTPTREMRIIDHNRWRQLHWNALVAAYERTPFFEYYADDFAAIYQGEYERLVDFNADLHHLVLRLLDIHPKIVVNEGEYLLLDAEGRLQEASISTQATLQFRDELKKQLVALSEAGDKVGETSSHAPMLPSWNYQDYREMIRPKLDYRSDSTFHPQTYYQIFSQRHGFLPNLSIVDLLFNMGPESRIVLRSSIC